MNCDRNQNGFDQKAEFFFPSYHLFSEFDFCFVCLFEVDSNTSTCDVFSCTTLRLFTKINSTEKKRGSLQDSKFYVLKFFPSIVGALWRLPKWTTDKALPRPWGCSPTINVQSVCTLCSSQKNLWYSLGYYSGEFPHHHHHQQHHHHHPPLISSIIIPYLYRQDGGQHHGVHSFFYIVSQETIFFVVSPWRGTTKVSHWGICTGDEYGKIVTWHIWTSPSNSMHFFDY